MNNSELRFRFKYESHCVSLVCQTALPMQLLFLYLILSMNHTFSDLNLCIVCCIRAWSVSSEVTLTIA